jgi:clan AA aspartic protease
VTGRVVGLQPRLGVTLVRDPGPNLEIEFVVDTGFEGTLTLPIAAVNALALPFYQSIPAHLADGSTCWAPVHVATILWDGAPVEVAVLAMGNRPLPGTLLLDGHDFTARFTDGGAIAVEPF